tara:strand:- start:646 stop:792 length:147 start_codon:yes stop_codon:yes gene_type:complete
MKIIPLAIDRLSIEIPLYGSRFALAFHHRLFSHVVFLINAQELARKWL